MNVNPWKAARQRDRAHALASVLHAAGADGHSIITDESWEIASAAAGITGLPSDETRRLTMSILRGLAKAEALVPDDPFLGINGEAV